MKVFILPSWCPTDDEPLGGTFFVEQAHAMAQYRPDWTVALCQFDLERSRLPWRPWHMPRFVRDWRHTPRMHYQQASSSLHVYRLWAPFLPGFGPERKWAANVGGLEIQAQFALNDFIQRFGKPDLIHAHAAYPGGGAAARLGRKFGVPVGLTEHTGPFPPPYLCRRDGEVFPLVTDAYAGASQAAAVSRSLADRIVSLGLKNDVAVLPNYLPDHFGSSSGGMAEARKDLALLSVGGPSYAKGTDLLLKALARADAAVRLCIVGSSPEFGFFQQMAADLGLAERIRWLGDVSREQISVQFNACDVFVLPSRGETFGVAFIEALAHGKPLIATRCGGPEDIVHAGNGVLIPPDSVDDLVEAIQRLTTHVRDYSPQALRKDFLTRFSASAVLPRIEEWYQGIVDGKEAGHLDNIADTRSSSASHAGDRLNILVLHRLGNPAVAPAFLKNHVFALRNCFPGHNYLYHDAGLSLPSYVAEQNFDAILLDVSFLTARWESVERYQAIRSAYAFVQDSSAVKIAFPQDEYDCNEILDEWMCDWGVDVVFSVISSGWDVLYPRYHKVGDIRLGYTGYIDEALVDRPTKAFSTRSVDIGYRTKKLPPYFGRIGENKWMIGHDVSVKARAAGLNVDIKLGDAGTLYGDEWYDFINESKFTLGANSGSSLLDPRGGIQRCVRAYLTDHPEATFGDVEAACFPGLDRHSFTAISPRVLEAALLNSAQILVEGDYSGIVRAGEHFVPIRHDASNFAEVLEAMSDFHSVGRMISRCREAVLSVDALRYKNKARMLLDLIGDLASRKSTASNSTDVEKAISRYTEEMLPKYRAYWRHQYFRARIVQWATPYPLLLRAIHSAARIVR